MKAILFDVTRCQGCERCVAACIRTNDLDPGLADAERSARKDGLSANKLSSIVEVASGHFARLGCMHCLEPSCVSACLVGALTKTPEGPVVYDPDKCIGCRYCMLSCPFHAPRYEWEKARPFVRKCTFCVDRIREGERPACVEECPYGAIIFGSREALLAEAHQRIEAEGSKYLPRVWGEHELGGTSILYVSDVDLAALGWPAEDTTAIPRLTEPLVHMTPFIGLGVMATITGLGWIVKRRMELASQDAEARKDER